MSSLHVASGPSNSAHTSKSTQSIQRCVHAVQPPRLHARETGTFRLSSWPFSRGRSLAYSDDSRLGDNIAGMHNTLFQSKTNSGGSSLRDTLKPATTTTLPQMRPLPSCSYLCGLAPRRAVRGLPNASHGALPLSCCMSVRIFLSLSSKPAIGVKWCGRATCGKEKGLHTTLTAFSLRISGSMRRR